MTRKQDQRLVDGIAEELIASLKLQFLEHLTEHGLFLQMGDERVGEKDVWFYPRDLAEVEEVRRAIAAKIKSLRSATLGQAVAAGVFQKRRPVDLNGLPSTPLSDLDVRAGDCKNGRQFLRVHAAAVIVARMYDFLERDKQPHIVEPLEIDR